MKRIVFEVEAFEDFNNWAIFDIKIFKKISGLIKVIRKDPFNT